MIKNSILLSAEEIINQLWQCYNNPDEFTSLRTCLSEKLMKIGTKQDELYRFLQETIIAPMKITNNSSEAKMISDDTCMVQGKLDVIQLLEEMPLAFSIPYAAVFQESKSEVKLIGLHTFIPSESEVRTMQNSIMSLDAFEQYEIELSNALLYRYAFENENDLTFEVDLPSHNMCLDKKKFSMLFDTDEEQLSQFDPHYLLIAALFEEDRDLYSAWWHISFRGSKEEKRLVRSIEYRAKTPNKDYVWYKTTITPIIDSQDQVIKLIGRIKNINERKTQERHLHQLSSKDSLTGLFNRRYTERLIDQYIQEEGGYGALLMIDLDDFKKVNDLYGHLEGDKTLLALASILKGVCSARDIIGRIGGDEFIVFLRKTGEKKVISDKAEQIINALNFGISGLDGEPKSTATIGISVYPFDGERFTILWTNADEALYRMKRFGKNTYGFYNEAFR